MLDKNCLRCVYFAHIHSHLNYGILTWGSVLSMTQLKELRKIQQQCVQLISKSKDHNSNELMRSLHIRPNDKIIIM